MHAFWQAQFEHTCTHDEGVIRGTACSCYATMRVLYQVLFDAFLQSLAVAQINASSTKRFSKNEKPPLRPTIVKSGQDGYDVSIIET